MYCVDNNTLQRAHDSKCGLRLENVLQLRGKPRKRQAVEKTTGD